VLDRAVQAALAAGARVGLAGDLPGLLRTRRSRGPLEGSWTDDQECNEVALLPDNEPHVGCTFQVDFYGFDQGDLFADVTFEAHPPTGPVQVLLTDRVFIGEDDNTGGGSQAGLDASATYTLDVDGIEPHPNQGFHVKLTIHADGSKGADTKHKVFWVTGCPPGTTTTTSTTTSSTSTTSTTLPTTTTIPTTTSESTTTTEPGSSTSGSTPSTSS